MIPRRSWLPVAWSSELGAQPLASMLLAEPLVLFRDGVGTARALADRCPHRAYPLSQGSVVSGELQCAYHGWRFDGAGECRAVPGLVGGDAARPERRAGAREVRESGGVLWAWAAPEHAAEGEPPVVASTAGDDALSFRWSFVIEAPLADVLENILDVPHTAFLHGGWFRSPGRGVVIEARVRRQGGRLEAEYIGEPVPAGVLGRLLAPQGGVVTHVDRFVMPAVAQVEYGLGARMRLVATTYLVPVSERRTRTLHVLSLAPRSLALVAMPLLAPGAWWVLRQDARALRMQAENMARHPELRFASTEADVLGPHLRQMLERAARGEPPPPDAEWTARLAP